MPPVEMYPTRRAWRRALKLFSLPELERGLTAFSDPDAPGNSARCFLGCAKGEEWTDAILRNWLPPSGPKKNVPLIRKRGTQDVRPLTRQEISDLHHLIEAFDCLDSWHIMMHGQKRHTHLKQDVQQEIRTVRAMCARKRKEQSA